jgi:hypothetical protein
MVWQDIEHRIPSHNMNDSLAVQLGGAMDGCEDSTLYPFLMWAKFEL